MPHCIGTYHIWLARLMRWYMKRSQGFNVRLAFRGRGSSIHRTLHGVPVRKAWWVAVYVRQQGNRRAWRWQAARDAARVLGARYPVAECNNPNNCDNLLHNLRGAA